MTRLALLLALPLTLACVSPAYAINKCTGADGKATFQDAPCTGKGQVIEAKPASGAAPNKAMPTTATGQPQTEAQRIEGLVAASQAERRKIELELRLVPSANDAIYQQRKGCDNELKALQAKKLQANNNLAGATWEGSISSEMSAVATRCASHSAEVRQEHETLRKECQALGGCK